MAKICPVCDGVYADANAFCPNDGSTLLTDRPSEDLVGSVIADRYRVERLLGEGGMGKVYLARHVRLPQQAAIKVMNATASHDEGAVARFNREAANAARIEHERVARVFDFGEWGSGLVYLAMEYVPGRTLRSLLEQEKRLSPVRAANIAYQVAEGLDAAHRLGIVHRDLKPDNIMVVTDDHGVDRCKVVDFGIAKASDASGTRLTSTGMIVGTPEFMSPEQVVGETVDARSDVYALALVTFQMLTGAIPFSGATPERVLMSRLMQPPATLAQVAPDVAWPESLQEALSQALQGEAASRTSTALEFGEGVVLAVEAWTGAAVMRGRTPMGMSAVTARPEGGIAAAAGMVPPPGAGRSATPTATPGTGPGADAGAGFGTRPGTGPGAALGAGRNATDASAPADAAMRNPGPGAHSSGATATVPPTPLQVPAGSGRGSRRLLLAGGAVVAMVAAGWLVMSRRDVSPDTSAAEQAFTAATPKDDPSASTAAVASLADSVASDTAPPIARAQRAPTGTQVPNAPVTPRDQQGKAAAPLSEPARVPSLRPTPPPPPGRTTSETEPGATALAARRELDSVRAVLQSDESGEAEARAAVPHLQRLLRNLGSASDSSWAYLALVSALGQAGEPQRGCTFLRSAGRLARTDAQRLAVQNYFASPALACVP